MNLFHQYLGSYPEIELRVMNVKYPLGASKILVEQITGDTFNEHANEIGVIVNNVSTIYNIYRTLRYNRPITEKIITVTGDLVDNPENVLIKIGMKANNLISSLELPTKEGLQVIDGGVIIGRSYVDYNLVLMPTTIGLTIKNQENFKASTCFNCGKCNASCPMQVTVSVALKALAKKQSKYYARCGANKCIGCGLCSYVCPAKINLKNTVLTVKKEIAHEK